MTTDSDAQPITGQMPQTDQKHMGGSHIEPGAPETTWKPKVTGIETSLSNLHSIHFGRKYIWRETNISGGKIYRIKRGKYIGEEKENKNLFGNNFGTWLEKIENDDKWLKGTLDC